MLSIAPVLAHHPLRYRIILLTLRGFGSRTLAPAPVRVPDCRIRTPEPRPRTPESGSPVPEFWIRVPGAVAPPEVQEQLLVQYVVRSPVQGVERRLERDVLFAPEQFLRIEWCFMFEKDGF